MILEGHPTVVRDGVGYWCATCDAPWPCEQAQIAWQEWRGGTGHRCQCRGCHPERFPRIPEDGAPYVTVDGRSGRGHREPQLGGFAPWQFVVELNGQRVHEPPLDWLVTEALAGEMGWLVRTVRHAGYPHYQCLCGGDACQRAEYGRVVLIGPGGMRLEGATALVRT